MRTCLNSDCPKTAPEITGQLCEIYYPYGATRCKRHFERWLETEPEVQKLHKEWKEKSNEN